ncbi:7266_t:CDS:2, partial [Gigaspora margarita]
DTFVYESFTNRKLIGNGSSSEVYSADYEDIGQTVALKGFYEISINEMIREVKILTNVHHHVNIIRFNEITKATEKFFVVLQFANNGNLRSYLLNHFSKLNWPTIIKMAKDISNGIKCLHKANIVHLNNDRLMITVSSQSKSLEDTSEDTSNSPAVHNSIQHSSMESNPAIERESINSFEYESFKNWKCINHGYFDVYSADSEDIGQTVTLKSLGRNLTDDKSYNDFVKEAKIITKVHYHVNILQFFGITKDATNETYYMVLRFANNGDLRSYLKDHFLELDWPTKIKMAMDISNGVKWLHKADIVHRDLSKIESSTVAFQTLNIAISKDDNLKSAATNFQNACSTFRTLHNRVDAASSDLQTISEDSRQDYVGKWLFDNEPRIL